MYQKYAKFNQKMKNLEFKNCEVCALLIFCTVLQQLKLHKKALISYLLEKLKTSLEIIMLGGCNDRLL